MIRRCFSNLTREKVIILYTSLVRPILEYASPAWNPYLKKDIQALEYSQRRCLRLAGEGVSLQSLSSRRLFIDLCEVFKYTHSCYKNGMTDMFAFTDNPQLRGNPFKLKPLHQIKTTVRQHFFSERVINEWNALHRDVVSAPSVACFKERLKRSLPTGQEG